MSTKGRPAKAEKKLTQAEQMAALRAKRREAGFIEIVIWTHRADRAQIRKYARQKLKAQPGAEAVFPVEDF